MIQPIKIVFLNGVLEVSTGEFLEHNREDYITWGLDFNYNPTLDPGSHYRMDLSHTIW